MSVKLCPCGSGKPLKKCCFKGLSKLIDALSAMRDMGLPLDSTVKDELEGFNADPYPSLHRKVFESLKKGELKILEIKDVYGETGFSTFEGKRYWYLKSFTPLERRPFYVFNFDGINVALPSYFAARNLRERLATLNSKDEEEFKKALESVKNENISVEGYNMENYTIAIPYVVLRNMDDIIKKARAIKTKKMENAYVLYIGDTNHIHLPRYYPNPNFTYYEVAGILYPLRLEEDTIIVCYSDGWSRAEVMYQVLGDRVIDIEYIKLVKEDETTLLDFSRPENEPQPLRYDEIARFYENLMDYEIDGKPLRDIKTTDKVLYNEVIKTFAFIEAQLTKWKATAYPYNLILRHLVD